jgi:nucleoside-diphosphate-sugar epimerase
MAILFICIRKRYRLFIQRRDRRRFDQTIGRNHPKITGHQGEIIWDATKPMVPRKLMDIKMHALGWKHQVQLEEGIQKPTIGFVDNIKNVKKNIINK